MRDMTMIYKNLFVYFDLKNHLVKFDLVLLDTLYSYEELYLNNQQRKVRNIFNNNNLLYDLICKSLKGISTNVKVNITRILRRLFQFLRTLFVCLPDFFGAAQK